MNRYHNDLEMCWVLPNVYVMKIDMDIMNFLAMPAPQTLAILTGFP